MKAEAAADRCPWSGLSAGPRSGWRPGPSAALGSASALGDPADGVSRLCGAAGGFLRPSSWDSSLPLSAGALGGASRDSAGGRGGGLVWPAVRVWRGAAGAVTNAGIQRRYRSHIPPAAGQAGADTARSSRHSGTTAWGTRSYTW